MGMLYMTLLAMCAYQYHCIALAWTFHFAFFLLVAFE